MRIVGPNFFVGVHFKDGKVIKADRPVSYRIRAPGALRRRPRNLDRQFDQPRDRLVRGP